MATLLLNLITVNLDIRFQSGGKPCVYPHIQVVILSIYVSYVKLIFELVLDKIIKNKLNIIFLKLFYFAILFSI